MDFDTFFEESDIKYRLVATVDGEVAGVLEDYDPNVIVSKIHQLEGEVVQLVESNYQDKAEEAKEAHYGR